MTERGEDPTRLLRNPEPVEPYPVEASDEEVADLAGVPVASVLRFDMNTLAGGALPGAAQALRAYDPDRLAEYGDQGLRALRAAVSRAIGVPAARIIPGAGADELIRLLTANVAAPGQAVVVATPTFAMFGVEARLVGATVVEVVREQPDRRQSLSDLRAAVAASGARLVWLCSPNNPTADAFDPEEIRSLAAGLDAIVAVDCVYQEFAEASLGLAPEALSLAPMQAELPNLVILRSLAKAYGLAGARVGYLVMDERLAPRFAAARLPLPIGGPSEAAALGALEDLRAARARHAEVVAERARLAAELAARGWRVLPSVTNFLLAEPPAGQAARAIAERLLRSGIAVRSYEQGQLQTWLRITARRAADNDRLLGALDARDRPA